MTAPDVNNSFATVAKVLAWPCIIIALLLLWLGGSAIYWQMTQEQFDPQPRTVPGATVMSCAQQQYQGDAVMVRLLSSNAGKHIRLEDCP